MTSLVCGCFWGLPCEQKRKCVERILPCVLDDYCCGVKTKNGLNVAIDVLTHLEKKYKTDRFKSNYISNLRSENPNADAIGWWCREMAIVFDNLNTNIKSDGEIFIENSRQHTTNT